MKGNKEHATKETSSIQCLEVLISKRSIVGNQNLHWTLSVYSLENQPVRKNLAIQNSEIFHFMVFDWKRTIKKLLEENQIPYSIIRHFAPGSIYMDSVQEDFCAPDHEIHYLVALRELQGAEDQKVSVPVFTSHPEERDQDLILEEGSQ